MSTDNKVQPINGEKALHDAIHIVCEYLSSNDLLNISKVCKWWREVAIRENSNRFNVQLLYLPCKINDLDSRLYVLPTVSLLIYDTTLEKSPLSCFPWLTEHDRSIFPKKMLEKFRSHLPNTVMVLCVDEHVTMFAIDRLDSKVCGFVQSGKWDILGVFLPSMERRVRVHVASHVHRFWSRRHGGRDQLVNRLAGELGLNDCDPYSKTTIIQLTAVYGTDHTLIGDLAKRAQENGKEVTWYSIFGAKLVVSHSNSESSRTSWTTSAFIRLSGPAIESWTTFIHFLAGHDEIRSKLDQLNARVKRKRNNIGFFYAPTCRAEWCNHANHPCGNSLEMQHSLTRAFHDIRFTGFFVNTDVYSRMESGSRRRFFQHLFDENDERSLNKDFLEKLADYVSIIIISYN